VRAVAVFVAVFSVAGVTGPIGPAGAAPLRTVVSVQAGVLTVVDDPGHQADITLIEDRGPRFLGADLVAGPGCTQDGAAVRCNAAPVSRLDIRLGDLRDRLGFDRSLAFWGKPARFDSGAGDDDIEVGYTVATVFGGAGRDRISGGMVGSVVNAGPDNDYMLARASDHRYNGEGGFDTVSYESDLRNLKAEIRPGGGYAFPTDPSYNFPTDTFASVEVLIGGRGNDELHATGAPGTLYSIVDLWPDDTDTFISDAAGNTRVVTGPGRAKVFTNNRGPYDEVWCSPTTVLAKIRTDASDPRFNCR